jgi:hypothetical protein
VIKLKEGYLQEKIRELDFKLKQQMALAEQLDKHLQRIIVSEKEQKKLFNKLKKLDEYKDEIRKDIEMKNKKEIKSSIDKSKETINKKIDDAIEKHLGKIQKQMDKISNQLQQIEIVRDLALKNSENVVFTQHLCNLIMEELVRERVFSKEKIEILSKRASIRAKDSSRIN